MASKPAVAGSWSHLEADGDAESLQSPSTNPVNSGCKREGIFYHMLQSWNSESRAGVTGCKYTSAKHEYFNLKFYSHGGW